MSGWLASGGPFQVGRSLRWRHLIAFQFLNLWRTLFPSWTKFMAGRNGSRGTLLLHAQVLDELDLKDHTKDFYSSYFTSACATVSCKPKGAPSGCQPSATCLETSFERSSVFVAFTIL